MDHFAGLDVSVKETSVCIVDDTGRIIREADIARMPNRRESEPRSSLPEDLSQPLPCPRLN
jgi:hypothetical protein